MLEDRSSTLIAPDQHQRNFTSSLTYYRKSLVKSRLKSNYLSLYILYIDTNLLTFYSALHRRIFRERRTKKLKVISNDSNDPLLPLLKPLSLYTSEYAHVVELSELHRTMQLNERSSQPVSSTWCPMCKNTVQIWKINHHLFTLPCFFDPMCHHKRGLSIEPHASSTLKLLSAR
jgi:hypothetical protein